MKADKTKVVNEVWDEARVDSFLVKGPMGPEPEQFSQLLHAYRSMRAEDFARFVERFIVSGGDVNATNNDGQSLAQVIAAHKKSAPFLTILGAG